MQPGTDLPVVAQAGAASVAANPLQTPGAFLGFDLNLLSDRLYDMDSVIPDVIGLRAIQPDAAVIKVMSIPDNHCIRVVIPDDHVPIEFQEVLIHDMEVEEPPFVALSELGCLPPSGLAEGLVYIYGTLSVGSRTVAPGVQRAVRIHTIRLVYIQQNLGRHVACYHMDLAQLWRCPVTWCTEWRGNMRKAHNTPATVKAANLARWFPPWTVSREQWTRIMQSSVSGIAIDALLYSHIGVLLFHRYSVFSRHGTHVAFRRTYMTRIRTFLEESDAASLRARHRRHARAIAARRSQTDSQSAGLSSPEICAGCCCCSRFSNRKGASISPQQSPDYSGVDGPCAPEVRSPREVVRPTAVAMVCYE